MNPIRLPRSAAKMKAFAEIETASHGRAVEIRQTGQGAVMTVADGRQLCRLSAPAPAGSSPAPVEPFLVDARELAKAAAEVGCSRTEAIVSTDPGHVATQDRPLIVATYMARNEITKKDEQVVGIAGPEGTPQTIGIVWGSMPNCAGIIDTIQGEAASGMTRAVCRLNPKYLQNLADMAVAVGLTSIEITFAPRWNFLLAEGTAADGCELSVAIAGIGDIDLNRPATTIAVPATDDGMTFTMPVARPRGGPRPKRPTDNLPLSFEDDLPF